MNTTTTYREEGVRQLRAGKKCDSCENIAVIVYATSCHGYWFYCEPHNKEHLKMIDEIDKKYASKEEK